eukprot:INCI7192.11.p1 GENE.INCI7192.11~~INCI7192.11.p1  ORF type:complete len:1394 (+),score=213.38 INCI7192.11:2388-6569(+)
MSVVVQPATSDGADDVHPFSAFIVGHIGDTMVRVMRNGHSTPIDVPILQVSRDRSCKSRDDLLEAILRRNDSATPSDDDLDTNNNFVDASSTTDDSELESVSESEGDASDHVHSAPLNTNNVAEECCNNATISDLAEFYALQTQGGELAGVPFDDTHLRSAERRALASLNVGDAVRVNVGCRGRWLKGQLTAVDGDRRRCTVYLNGAHFGWSAGKVRTPNTNAYPGERSLARLNSAVRRVLRTASLGGRSEDAAVTEATQNPRLDEETYAESRAAGNQLKADPDVEGDARLAPPVLSEAAMILRERLVLEAPELVNRLMLDNASRSVTDSGDVFATLCEADDALRVRRDDWVNCHVVLQEGHRRVRTLRTLRERLGPEADASLAEACAQLQQARTAHRDSDASLAQYLYISAGLGRSAEEYVRAKVVDQTVSVRQQRWREMFRMLEKYKAEHNGDANPPSSLSATGGYPGLGAWIQSQRQAYGNEIKIKDGQKPKNGFRISTEQIAELEKLGFDWKRDHVIDARWEKNFRGLQQFAQTHGGNANPPRRFSTPEFPNLGQWAGRQREAYQNEQRLLAGEPMSAGGNRISPEQIQRLNDLGFQWAGRLKSQWESKFNLLLKFASAHNGNASPPVTLDTPEYPKLGKWVDTQRGRFLSNKMPQNRISKMEAVGFIWKPRDAKIRSSWRKNFELLKKYADNHDGDANPPTKLDTAEYPRLGQWLQTQRLAYQYEQSVKAGTATKTRGNNRITEARISQLEALGVIWALRKTQSCARWEHDFSMLTEYANAHGGNANPSTTLDTKKYPKLGMWVSRQRAAYQQVRQKAANGKKGQRADRISPAQIEKLEKIGFLWSTRQQKTQAQWLRNFEQLKSYAATHGGATNPPKSDPQYRKLAVWATTQRSAYRSLHCEGGMKPKCHNKISDDAIHKLNSIGFDWSPRTSTKRSANGAAKKSQRKTISLGTMEKQLQMAHQKASTSRARWLTMFRMLKEYARKHEGDCSPPTTLDTSEFPKLGQWVRKQRSAYSGRSSASTDTKDSGQRTSTPFITDEQVELLNTIGFVWHGVNDARWEHNFQLLEKYAASHAGDANPSPCLDTSEYPKLGKWIATQRAAYANEQRRRNGRKPSTETRISDDRILRLEDLGFHWTRKSAGERRWCEKFLLLKKYAAAHDGDANPSIKLNTDEFPGLGAWLSRQRQGYANELARKAGRKPGNARRITPEHAAKLLAIGVRLSVNVDNCVASRSIRTTSIRHDQSQPPPPIDVVKPEGLSSSSRPKRRSPQSFPDSKRPGIAKKKQRRRALPSDASSDTDSAESTDGACASRADSGTNLEPLVPPSTHGKRSLGNQSLSLQRCTNNSKRVVTANSCVGRGGVPKKPKRKRTRRQQDEAGSKVIDLT